VVCDFDGTITDIDTIDALLERFAPGRWEDIEGQWLAGLISARECLSRQIPLIQANKDELDGYLDGIPLTPGFEQFVALMRGRGHPPVIISDGLDYVIKRLLARSSLMDMPVAANHLTRIGDGYALSFPHSREGCGSGVCKCEVAERLKGPMVLIGDGRSDFCLADRASLVLAKAGRPLAAYCQENDLPYAAYEDFFDLIEICDIIKIWPQNDRPSLDLSRRLPHERPDRP
jgi:2,3-diketo-5-methylthio-1-phosphopentane phosphatase